MFGLVPDAQTLSPSEMRSMNRASLCKIGLYFLTVYLFVSQCARESEYVKLCCLVWSDFIHRNN
jgi:hypothetical protein